jgi:sugar (pentulose or hexulose) kinase
VFADVTEASERVRLRDEVTEPDSERARRYDELYGIYAGLYPALRDAMHALAG